MMGVFMTEISKFRSMTYRAALLTGALGLTAIRGWLEGRAHAQRAATA